MTEQVGQPGQPTDAEIWRGFAHLVSDLHDVMASSTAFATRLIREIEQQATRLELSNERGPGPRRSLAGVPPAWPHAAADAQLAVGDAAERAERAGLSAVTRLGGFLALAEERQALASGIDSLPAIAGKVAALGTGWASEMDLVAGSIEHGVAALARVTDQHLLDHLVRDTGALRSRIETVEADVRSVESRERTVVGELTLRAQMQAARPPQPPPLPDQFRPGIG